MHLSVNPYRRDEHECHCGGTCDTCSHDDAPATSSVAPASALLSPAQVAARTPGPNGLLPGQNPYGLQRAYGYDPYGYNSPYSGLVPCGPYGIDAFGRPCAPNAYNPYGGVAVIPAGAITLSPNTKTALYVAGGLAAAVGLAYAYKRYSKPSKKSRRG